LAGEHIVAETAGDEIHAGTTENAVSVVITIQSVVAGTTDDEIVAESAADGGYQCISAEKSVVAAFEIDDGSRAGCDIDSVIAIAGIDSVGATVGTDDVVARGARESVIARGARNGAGGEVERKCRRRRKDEPKDCKRGNNTQ